MLLLKYKRAWAYFKTHKFTHDEKRNRRLGAIVSAYGVSFSVEKLLLAMGNPLSDFWWFIIYGVFALISTAWWFDDFILDLWEMHTTEDDELYQKK